MKCLSSTTSARAELLRHAEAALRRVWIQFSTQVKTIKEKERCRLLVGLVQAERALSWPQSCHERVRSAAGKMLGCSSLQGYFLSSFAAKICVPPPCDVWCACALLLPSARQGPALLLLSERCSPEGNRAPSLLLWNVCLC